MVAASVCEVSVEERGRKVESTYCLPLAAFSASVPMTLPKVSRLVLMYFPSRVRSLSEVAFSDPAKSIKLYKIRS